jgi:hypothetical protein
LDRLAVVAESLRDQPTPPRRVNLSLDQQAVVELTAATPPPAVAARRATRP